ncbi:MAG: molybdopterin-dependent oxidoreductase [Gemmatimonadetes bacterium]|nr:molybdopterin-dependent oxidoreductase [Gemmatimonadota bacterium]
MQFQVTRRAFLVGTGALFVAVSAPALSSLADRWALPRSLRDNRTLDTWLRIDAGGTVTAFSGKVELGQGIRTALAQIVSDELDVSIDRLRMASVDTGRSPDEGRTAGSDSVADSGSALRHAAAQARRILLDNAGARLTVDPGELRVDDGVVHTPDGRSVSYWELLGDRGFDADLRPDVIVKAPAESRSVGTSLPRLDLPAKVFGEPAFIQDLRLPDMVHARVVRGGTVARQVPSGAEDTVRGMPGVVDVVRDGDFLAVVAGREEQAIAAAAALRETMPPLAPAPEPPPDDVPSLLRQLEASDEVIADTSRGAPGVAREFSAEYSRPFLSHASLGPSCAIAQWDGDTMTVWSHAQGMYPLRDAIAEMLGLSEDRVRCIHADGAGCYGHNGADDAACDAALIARAMPGRPVRLQWMRDDEFRHAPVGSAMSLHASAGLDAAGRIVRWRYDIYSGSHSMRPSGGRSVGNLLAAREKTDPFPPARATDRGPPEGGADRNAVPLYRFENQRITKHIVQNPPLRTSALRSLGAHGNVFAIESFIDEIARAVGADPFEYRLRHLDDSRARDVLSRLRELAADAPAAMSAGRSGRGLAFAQYKNSSAYLALVVDVDIDPGTGRIRVVRALAAADVGRVVNPDGVRNQIEGGIVQATSWTLREQVRFSAGGVESTDWATYPILGFRDAPEIDVVLIDRPDEPSVGVGEAAQGPTSAAIANAVADAVGVRLRHLPFTPARMNAALRA